MYLFPPLQGSMIPKPRFLQKRINEVAIGTFRQIATVQESASVYDALTIFVERRVSALPVVNEQGSLNINWLVHQGKGLFFFLFYVLESQLSKWRFSFQNTLDPFYYLTVLRQCLKVGFYGQQSMIKSGNHFYCVSDVEVCLINSQTRLWFLSYVDFLLCFNRLQYTSWHYVFHLWPVHLCLLYR